MKPQTKNGCTTPLLMVTGSLVTFGELHVSFLHTKLKSVNTCVYAKSCLQIKNFHILGLKLSKLFLIFVCINYDAADMYWSLDQQSNI